MKNPKPFDQMTMAEVGLELERIYHELLEESVEDSDAATFHTAATEAFTKLKANFSVLLDMEKDASADAQSA